MQITKESTMAEFVKLLNLNDEARERTRSAFSYHDINTVHELIDCIRVWENIPFFLTRGVSHTCFNAIFTTLKKTEIFDTSEIQVRFAETYYGTRMGA